MQHTAEFMNLKINIIAFLDFKLLISQKITIFKAKLPSTFFSECPKEPTINCPKTKKLNFAIYLNSF